MALDAAALATAIIDAVNAAIEAVDKDPESNPEMGTDINEGMWTAVAEEIVVHIVANAEVVDSSGSATGETIE